MNLMIDPAALAKALKENSALAKLDLSVNEFEDVHLAALDQALEKNSALTKLDLTCLSMNQRTQTLLSSLKH